MGIDFDKLRTSFDKESFCDVYIAKCGLRKEQVERFLAETMQIQQMGISGLAWFPTDHLISIYPNIPLLHHYEALSAAFHQPFEGIEGFYRQMIEYNLLPAWTLNQTRFIKFPNARLLVGDLMCELGLISEHTLQRSLGIQRLIQEKVKKKPALATIIAAVDSVSILDLFQALGIQSGIAFESLDASAPVIFEETGKRIFARSEI